MFDNTICIHKLYSTKTVETVFRQPLNAEVDRAAAIIAAAAADLVPKESRVGRQAFRQATFPSCTTLAVIA